MSGAGRRFSVTASTLAVTVALGALLVSGQGALEWPPLTAPSEWHRWLSEREPADAFVTLLRLGALVLCWYLLAAMGVGVVARAVGSRSLIRAIDAVSLPAVRVLVRWALGAGLTASTAVAGSPAFAARPASPAITMTRIPDPAHPTPSPTPTTAGTATTAGSAVAAAVPSAPVTTWEVRPGQCLWRIARDVESVRRGREATDREVSAYWRALIDANRDQLADPRNASLVFPGQVFRLPPRRSP